MPLAAGARLGPYEILSPIGSGGMGEVYKARDTRLDRIVAVKVLPGALSGDPEFKARFEREAKSISALNHPNICTLHDVGEAPGEGRLPVSFLVMEYLDGETLADRIKKGPVPVDQALEIAGQMASALDKAHRSGIVHRDLKPANVFLVRSVGTSGAPHCKLLDFGLAKVGGASVASSIETRLEATAKPDQPLTAKGTILGTFQYMAPEQVEGHEADARTDIWAFGCVLYEMLTGKRAFEGRSQAGLMASILERQPAPVSELQPLVPPALGRVVRTCLEKDPDNRFHTAHDLALQLEWIEEGGSAAGLPAPVVAGRKRRGLAVFGAAAIGVAAVAAAAAWWLKPAPVPIDAIMRFSYLLGDGVAYSRIGRHGVAISPDGTKIAFIANNQIYLRRIAELDAQPIRGTVGLDPVELTFSPDGESLAFFVPAALGGPLEGAILKKIAVTGGAPTTLCAAGVMYGMRWQNDRIVFSLGDRILSVPETAGTPDVLITAASPTETLSQPQLVGDGRTMLYTIRTGTSFNDGQIVVQPIGGGPRRVLMTGGMDARILPSGHLIWVHDNTLYAQPIDLGTLRLTGGQVPVIEGIRQTLSSGAGQLSVADNGTFVFEPGTLNNARSLTWVDRNGHEEPTGALEQAYQYPRISPDGKKVAAATTEGDQDIFVWEFERKAMTKLTAGPDVDSYPVWTPDNQFILFRSTASADHAELYRRAVNGTGKLERLTNGPDSKTPQTVLPDGARVLIRRSPSDTALNGVMEILPLAPGGAAIPVFSTLRASNAEISPDGRWIAYQSAEGSTRDEVHVRPFPNTEGGHWPISSGGGQRPMWSRSGRELVFLDTRTTAGALSRVEVLPASPAGAFSFGPPTTMFGMTPYSRGGIGRGWDISADDKRFLMVKFPTADVAARDAFVVVTHWFDELKARVKAK